MRSLFSVYASVPAVTMARHTACTDPTVLGLSNMAFTAENSWLPSRPPAAAPSASGVPVDRDTRRSPASMARPTE